MSSCVFIVFHLEFCEWGGFLQMHENGPYCKKDDVEQKQEH
jgi:hypothetical protein